MQREDIMAALPTQCWASIHGRGTQENRSTAAVHARDVGSGECKQAA
jgi:hypothetical protein